MEKPKLPEGWEWQLVSDVAEVNPRRLSLTDYPDGTPVTFVPMAAVDEHTGSITKAEIRMLSEVRKGYTFFQNGDVLFAKITPCMENGKSAIATDLATGVGFGSTEFHVIRPGPLVTAEWLHRFVRQPSFRRLASQHFTGSVGHKRVPQQFIENQEIPLPPLAEQRRIVACIEELTRRVEEAKRIAEAAQKELDALVPAILDKAFKGQL